MLTRLLSTVRSRGTTFWTVTAVLLLLYGWTLTESIPLTIKIDNGLCTAVLPGRHSTIPCPNLARGEVGLYQTSTSLIQKLWFRPLEALTPGAAWSTAVLHPDSSSMETTILHDGRSLGNGTAETWPARAAQIYTIEAHVQRPEGEHVGILLLESGGEEGLMFVVDSEDRLAIWQHWRDGKPGEPISGVPYQKPLLAQAQSLLRKIIATFLGALAVIAIVVMAMHLMRSASKRLGISAISDQRNISLPIPHSALRNPHSALLIILSGFGVSLWIAIDVLEMIPHVQDSITFFFQAQTMAEGLLWAPAPPHPQAFSQEFLIVWDGKWFGQYPPGYPAVLALGILAGGHWLVNPWLAALSVALLIKLGSLLYRPRIGIIVGLLGLLSPFFLFLSGSLMVHTVELFWALLLMVSWTLALRPPQHLRWALLAGGALGMLLLTRQITAVAVGGSFVVLMLLASWREIARRDAGRSVAGLLAAAVPFALLLFAYQAAITGSPGQDPRLLVRPFDRPGFGAHIGEKENAFVLHSTPDGIEIDWDYDPEQPPRGHSLARGLFNTERNLEMLTGQLFGWFPLFTLAFCWMPFLFGKPRRADWLMLGLLLTVIAVYVAYWTTGIMYGPRYYYTALPALLLLTARGLQILAQRYGRIPTAMVFAILVVLALLFYWPPALSSLRGYNFISDAERAQVEETVERPAIVFIPAVEWWDYGRFFSGNTPRLDGRIIYARDLGQARNACLQTAYPDRKVYVWQPATESVLALEGGSCLGE